jgi:hypothetical protein
MTTRRWCELQKLAEQAQEPAGSVPTLMAEAVCAEIGIREP